MCYLRFAVPYLILIIVSIQLLDWLLGKGHFALMRRAELKTLVDMHGNEVSIHFSSKVAYPF